MKTLILFITLFCTHVFALDYSKNNYVLGAWNIPGHTIHFPKAYSPTGQSYPLIIFLHGLGEVGNGTTDLAKLENAGLPQVMKNAAPGWNDDHIPMIVMSPQIGSGFDWDWDVKAIENAYAYAIKNYNVDTNRVYITGLSLGGRGTFNAMKDPYLASKVAAFVSISAIEGSGLPWNTAACEASKKMGAWHFEGASDNQFKNALHLATSDMVSVQVFFGKINACKIQGYTYSTPVLTDTDVHAHAFNNGTGGAYASGFDIYAGYPNEINETTATITIGNGLGHSGWNNVYTGAHGGTAYGADKVKYNDIYKWMLSYSLAPIPPVVVEPPPVVQPTQIVEMDFGSADLPTKGMNNIVDSTNGSIGKKYEIFDNQGKATSITLEIIKPFNSSNPNGTRSPATLEAFVPATAASDSLWGNTVAYANGVYPKAQIKLSGLNVASKYTFYLFASRIGAGGQIRETLYSLDGSASFSTTLDAAENVDKMAKFIDVVPKADGTFVLSLEPGPKNTSPFGFFYLNYLRLEAK